MRSIRTARREGQPAQRGAVPAQLSRPIARIYDRIATAAGDRAWGRVVGGVVVSTIAAVAFAATTLGLLALLAWISSLGTGSFADQRTTKAAVAESKLFLPTTLIFAGLVLAAIALAHPRRKQEGHSEATEDAEAPTPRET